MKVLIYLQYASLFIEEQKAQKNIRDFDIKASKLNCPYNNIKNYRNYLRDSAPHKTIRYLQGPLELVSKTTANEACSNDEEDDGEEGILMNSNDKVLAYYSKIRPRDSIGNQFVETLITAQLRSLHRIPVLLKRVLKK